MIRPIEDRVLLEKIKEDNKTESGIILSSVTTDNKIHKYKVVEIGPGGMSEKGEIKMVVSKNDTVLVSEYSGSDFTDKEIDYKIVRQADILAIIE